MLEDLQFECWGSRNACKLGQILAGGKPPIRVCQHRSPSGHARLGAAGYRRSPCRRCDWIEPLVECPAGRKKRGKWSRDRPESGRSAGEGRLDFRARRPRFCAGPASEMKGGGARERARAAHLLVVLVEILVRVGHLPRHRLRLIVQDGFIPDDGQRLGDVDGPSPERGTRHLPRKPALSRCPRICGFPITARGLPPSGPMAR